MVGSSAESWGTVKRNCVTCRSLWRGRKGQANTGPSIESGLVDMHTDEIEVDPDRLEA